MQQKNKDQDTNQKVPLETLLKFKQMEKPSEEFWDRFDSQLKDKMLGSLVKKHRFSWVNISNVFKFSLPRLLPASVAALFVFAIWMNHDDALVTKSVSVSAVSSSIQAAQFNQFVEDRLDSSPAENTFSMDLSSNALYVSDNLSASGLMEYTSSSGLDVRPVTRSIVY